MSETKHTPGPWEARDEYLGGTAARWTVGRMEFGPEHTLARVLAPNGRPHGTAEANARLIAAAPDMLEAGRELSEAAIDYASLVSAENFNPNDIAVHRAYGRLSNAIYSHRVALDKAEGRS